MSFPGDRFGSNARWRTMVMWYISWKVARGIYCLHCFMNSEISNTFPILYVLLYIFAYRYFIFCLHLHTLFAYLLVSQRTVYRSKRNKVFVFLFSKIDNFNSQVCAYFYYFLYPSKILLICYLNLVINSNWFRLNLYQKQISNDIIIFIAHASNYIAIASPIEFSWMFSC